MTLPSSGPLSLSDIQGEFGGSNPIGMNEYYAGGGLVPSGTTGTYGAVPTSGQISVQNFYGTSNFVPIYIENVFSTYLYTGNATGSLSDFQNINNSINLSANGGLVWGKSRSNNSGQILIDSARGLSKVIQSDATYAETTQPTIITSFNSNGFTLGSDNGATNLNRINYTYGSWTFRKQPKFFDIVTYTGNGVTGRQISHNLGCVPGAIIIKNTSSSTNWAFALATNLSNWPGTSKLLCLNTTDQDYAGNTYSNGSINDATSTTFQVVGFAGNQLNVNQSGQTYVAYLFASNAGGFGPTGTDNVITCGAFTGATNVNLGYEPQWVLVKSTSIAQDWFIIDNMRGWTVDGAYNFLQPNNIYAEAGGTGGARPTSTGFYWPYAGNSYIYIAIRRGPMKVPTVGTSVFSPVTYSGNAGSQTITSGFPIDLLLEENRNKNFTYSNWAVDRLRGSNLQSYTDLTNAQGSDGTYKSFESNTAMVLSGNGNLNGSGANYISWFFGRAPSFFDQVCYTGTGGTGQTITHNLGVSPELIISKRRDSTGDWYVYHPILPSLNKLAFLLNNNSTGTGTGSGATTLIWQPSTTTFWADYNALDLNNNGGTFVTYLFATCAGVSKVGNYTGTGALLTVNCGFTTGARFVLIKRVDSTGDWYVWDSARGISSGNDPYLILNGTQPVSEVTGTNYVDTTSVGFQVTAAAPSDLNASGGKYIFLAIA